ncbi:MAG TPA: hypothetical protein ENN19_17880 [Chloroflexi bacterium]|nr:hypothetical protein [Chloroflexota bacterium]
MSYYQQQPQQPMYYGSQYSGCLKIILYLLSFFIPLVGVIIGLVFMSRPDPESKQMGQTCLILGVISIFLSCCLGTIFGIGPFLILPFLDSGFYY